MLRILIVLFAVTSSAHAEVRKGSIVLESYTGERPADAPRLLAPVLEELSRNGYDAGDSVARSFETKSSRPALQTSGLPADFSAQVDRGFKSWVAGRFEEAIGVLGPLIKTAQANTGAFAVNPSLREPLRKALIALALANKGNGDLSAVKATFGELLRGFPDAQVPKATYGPDAQAAFEQARKDLQSAGRGKLTVKVADESSVVFVNEGYRGAGTTTLELAPGEYRVVVVLNKQPSRNHVVDVKANGSREIAIDTKLDQALHTEGYTGFKFGNAADREAREASYAARFAKDIGASAVAVVGIDDVRGRSAVVGVLVSLQTGKELRRASIPVEPDPSTDKLRSLARFLAGENPAAGLDVQFASGTGDGGDGGGGDDGGGGTSRGRWGGWRWITAGAAVGAIGVGAVLVGLDGRCSKDPPMGQQCNDLYSTATPGFIALGGGAVLAGISIYLFATHDKAPYVALAPGGATFGFASRF